MDFTPLFAIAVHFRKLILGVGLIVVLAALPRSFAAVLAVVVVLVLLIVLVPDSVPYFQALWRATFNLLAFLLAGFG